MVETLATYANIRHAEIETIESTGDGFRVRASGEWVDASDVIVATPAHVASSLLSGVDGDLGRLLGAIPYSSSVIVSMVFEAAQFDGMHAGFGFLVPKRERDRMAACTFVATKFPHRAPDDKILLRCFFGGRSDEAILSESDESLITIAREELRRILGLTAAPVFTNISRWPRSMAQYTVGHGARVAEIKQRAAAIPGLQLAGNAYDGIGIPDCVRAGRQAASAIPRV
jgi:oxygen-dependent protoporphyrinogen oxidase